MKISEEIENRIRGCLFGHAVGDALGLGNEFLSKAEARIYYPDGLEFYDQIKRDAHRRRFPPGGWTDDTDQMLCVLDSILEQSTVDVLDVASRLYRWAARGGVGIGKTVASVLYDREFLVSPFEVSERVWVSSDRKAAANGAVMRTSVLGVWQFDSPSAVQRNAEDVCRITHFDPRCIASCVLVSVAISRLIQGSVPVEDLLEDLSALGDRYDSRVREYVERALSPDLDSLRLDDPETIGYTLKAMSAGLWALAKCGSFRDGILAVIHEGGDADTNAAVAGGLLGAKFGFSEIPERWVRELYRWEDLASQVDQFLVNLRRL